ncbi:MAG: DNA methyltransferase [Lachnospiraceae bacterium]
MYIVDFAYRTFIWDSEASIKAHVHCVIVGFSRAVNNKQKINLFVMRTQFKRIIFNVDICLMQKIYSIE